MAEGSIKTVCLASAGALALITASGAAAQTQAAGTATSEDDSQPDATKAASGLADIIVTARRRAENLQQVPVAVSVVTGDDLVRRGVTNINLLSDQVPSLKILGQGSVTKTLSVGIRGIAATSFLIADDAPVGTYFAEGVIAHPWGFGGSFFDIESVQVLKGPQGTLFGRNTTGGALLIEPRKPSFDGLGGFVQAGFGSYDLRRFEGAINVPLIADAAALRVAFVSNERNGYSRNIFSGQRLDSVDERGLRVQLRLTPVEGLDSNSIYDRLVDTGGPNAIFPTAVFPNLTSVANLAAYQAVLAQQQAIGPRRSLDIIGSGLPQDALAPSRCRTNPALYCNPSTLPGGRLETDFFLNNTSFETGDVTFKNIVSYRRSTFRNDGNNIIPLGEFGIGIQGQSNQRAEQFTNEFQVIGKSLFDRVDWILGAFYFRETGGGRDVTYQFSNASWGASENGGRNKSKAVFAQGDVTLTDQLKLTAGARYTRDTRRGVNESTSGNGLTCQIVPSQRDEPTVCAMSGENSWSAVTWTASLQYQANPDMMMYLTARRGYKSGGFSARVVERARFRYDPEFVQDVEAGMKADWQVGSVPVRTNLALFYSKLTDQQLQITEFSNTLNRPITYTANAGKSTSYGGELEVTAMPFQGFELGGYLSYVNIGYDEYMDPVRGDLSDTTCCGGVGVPRWQGALNAKYTTGLGDLGEFEISGNIAYRSRSHTDNALIVARHPTYNVQLEEAERVTINARAELRDFMGEPIDLSIFVTNLTNKLYKLGGTTVAGLQTASYAPPRMFGVEARVRFGSNR